MQHLFAVGIDSPSARAFHKNGYDYVALTNGSTYALKIFNNHDTRCDIEVFIDGEEVGKWIIHAHQHIRLERPANQARKFTFFKENSRVAKRTGVVSGAYYNGLVSVIFKPQKHNIAYTAYASLSPESSSYSRQESSLRASSPQRSSYRASSPERSSYRASSPERSSYRSGATVLGERSDQTFSNVTPLTSDQIDWKLSTEVSVRLVVEESQYVPLSPRTSYPPRLD